MTASMRGDGARCNGGGGGRAGTAVWPAGLGGGRAVVHCGGRRLC